MNLNRIIATIALIITTLQIDVIGQNNINLDGLIVDAEKIPLNGPLYVGDQTQLNSGMTNQLSTHISVFKSNNNKFFALTKNIEFSPNQSSGEIELYDSIGTLLWSKITELPVLKCQLSGDGKYCDAIIYHWTEFEDEDSEILIALNKKGEEIYREENVGSVYPNTNKDILYYAIYKGDTTYLKHKNLINGNKWRIAVPKESYVGAVSEEGGNVIICSNKGLFSYSDNGILLWSETSLIGGQASLSNDGSYLIKRCTNGSFNIYNNNAGSLISSLSSQNFNGELGYPYYACFIKNTNDKIAVLFYFKSNKSLPDVLGIYDKNGKLICFQPIEHNSPQMNIDCIYNLADVVTIFYDDLEVAKISIKF